MPYCVQCGTQVGSTDQFCGKCGTRQATATGSRFSGMGPTSPRAGSPPPQDFFSNISGRNASLLCYIPLMGWIAAIIVLASDKFRENTRVRFHAFQGLYLFVAWLIVRWVISPASGLGVWFGYDRMIPSVLGLVVFAGWIVMLVKVHQNEDYRLPLIGELADRSVSEQSPF